MVKIEFFPMDMDYVTGPKGKGIIRIFGKAKSGKRICVFDDSFKPYFWIIPKKNVNLDNFRKKIEKIKVKERDREAFVLKTELYDKKYLDKKIKAIKVIVNNPKDVPIIKDKVKVMKETEGKKEIDIPFIRRYLIDKEMIPLALYVAEGDLIKTNMDVDYVLEAKKVKQISKEVIKKPKILAFDLEMYNAVGRYTSEKRDPIIMVAFSGSDNYKKVVTWKSFSKPKDYIEFVKDEEALIQRFKEVIKEYKPDYLVGYFSDGFDFPYIKARADKYGIRLDLGLDKSVARFSRRGETTTRIKGIVHLDICKFIRRIMSGSLQIESYDLSSVAKELIGEEKLDIKIEDMFKAWDKGGKEIEKFCDYNLQDAKLTLRLTEKILPNLNELVKLIGQPIFDICRMSYGQLVEWHLIKRSKEFNEICPNRPTYDKIMERRRHTYKGAFVFEPKPGLYENIVVFDYKSLYPSLIVAKNISLGTLTQDKRNSYESPEIEIGRKKVHYYFTRKKGFIPSVIEDIIKRRIEIKKLIKKEKKMDAVLRARDYALKTLGNSSYGYFGFFGARYYSIECAASITAFARDCILKTIDDARKKGFNVIYSDTDSVVMVLEDKTEKDVLDFLNGVNKELPSLMELELENFYSRGIFVMKKSEARGAKKKYALIDREDKIKVVGFEAIRRDWSLLAKEVQNKVLEIILKENDVEKALAYVKDIIKKIREKKIDMEKMIIQTQLKKDIDSYVAIGPHVVVARRMKQKGLYVGAGSVIQYIVTEGKGIIRERAKLPEEAKDYDAEYYVNNQILPTVGKIFEVLGYKDLGESHEQSKLGDFK